MYDDDDLTTLDLEQDSETDALDDDEADLDFVDPLDQLEPLDGPASGPQLNPEVMLPLLASSDTQQRMLAARAFCDLQDSRAVPALIGLLQDLCPLIRVSASYGLGRNPDSTAVEPLIQQLHQDWNGYVRKGIVWALGNCRDGRTLVPLIEALRTDISAVRLWAASALAQMIYVSYDASVAAMPPLIEALRRDAIAAVRSNCAWAVGQLCRELPANVVYATAIDALIETFAEEDDLGVREDARAALLKLGDTRGLQTIEEIEQDGFF
ncbi:HEAT repeat-containing protein [Halomicronema hongdechloris C2206]|uniref:HEAT repeat-containing protein n=1 Tax=Halomicronema hongdechloris C2206 TaxID=1641165 RepID=A0A1Z3HUB7_9CYAN|nr:HEAT repeat domain-containing protein [Halomicronema hongdechloris]ASC73908.1 HEAT repeat-containing protein [Halomicronema hongdechloris C2206]